MMKLIFLLLTTLTFAANEPVYIKGQADATALKFRDLQAPNKQITKTGTENFLVETGNQNLLENPSFEHPTVGFGWTDASTNTKSAEATVVIHGKKSLKIELSANDVNLTQESTLYASQFGGTTQGVASIRIKTDVLVKICTVEAGIVSTTNCLNSSLDNQWHIYKIPFVLGATSNGINLFVDSGTGTVYLDDAFVGAMEVTAVTDASRIAGEAVFAPTSSCIWFRSNAVIGAFSSTSACPGPTIIKEYVGDWQTTDANLPQITINALPAGVYKATFYVPLYSGAAAQNSLAINDGTTTCDAVNVHSNTDSGQGVVSCTFEYGTAGNRTFSLYGASSTSLINIENNTSGSATRGTKFQLEYYTSFSTYSSANADTDWVSCNHTTASFTGFGTVSAIQTQCKRQGSDLLIKGNFTSGTTTATEARVSLPVWEGVQLISKNTTVIPAIQMAGMWTANTTPSANIDYPVLIKPSVDYINFGYRVGVSTQALAARNALDVVSAGIVSINARIPIEGWQNSNIIIAELNGLEKCASTLDCTDTFSAYIDNAGNVISENVDWINGNCTLVSTGKRSCSFKSGIFTVSPSCSVTTTNAGSAGDSTSMSSAWVRTLDVSSLYYWTMNGTTFTNMGVYVSCKKQGVDYIGKTAKAVASDQNLRTPGITKAVFYSSKISSTGVVSNEQGDFISTCTNPSTGNYTCSFNASVFASTPNCQANLNAAVSVASQSASAYSESTSSVLIRVLSGGAVSNQDFNITCHGVSP